MILTCIRCASETSPWSFSKKLQGEVCISCHYAILVEDELALSGTILPNYMIPIKIEHL